jgi:hypothetical protein
VAQAEGTARRGGVVSGWRFDPPDEPGCLHALTVGVLSVTAWLALAWLLGGLHP